MLPSTQEIGYEATDEISWPAADGGMLVKNRLETLDGKGRGMDRGMADSGTFRGPRGGAAWFTMLSIICHTHILSISDFSAGGDLKEARWSH